MNFTLIVAAFLIGLALLIFIIALVMGWLS